MNILTFDVEEWYIEKAYKGADIAKYKSYDIVLGRILDLLDKFSTKATFFCLGSLVEDFPDVIKRIVSHGHEIGCHSFAHKWVNKMNDKDFQEDTRKSIDLLEQCCGSKVKSYRAPAFSIGEANKHAFEILVECGIENDASVFPAVRDFGGFPDFKGGTGPCRVNYNGVCINEFPISLTEIPIINKRIAYSGGGYFRLMPLRFVKTCMKDSEYVMCYFHVLDFLDENSKFMTKIDYEKYFKEPGTLKNRLVRYIKSNIGRQRTFNGVEALLDGFRFNTIEDAAKYSEKFPVITL